MVNNLMEKNPLAHLEDVQVDYYEEEDVLDVYAGDTKGVAASVGNGMNLFRDREGNITGFSVIGVSNLFTDDALDAIKRRRGNPPEGFN